jgi:hypothetical protein
MSDNSSRAQKHTNPSSLETDDHGYTTNNVSIGSIEASLPLTRYFQGTLKSIKIHNDPLKHAAPVVSAVCEIHLFFSVSPSFTHTRSISYNMNKRNTKGNGQEIDIDRVIHRSLKTKRFGKKIFKKNGWSNSTYLFLNKYMCANNHN